MVKDIQDTLENRCALCGYTEKSSPIVSVTIQPDHVIKETNSPRISRGFKRPNSGPVEFCSVFCAARYLNVLSFVSYGGMAVTGSVDFRGQAWALEIANIRV